MYFNIHVPKKASPRIGGVGPERLVRILGGAEESWEHTNQISNPIRYNLPTRFPYSNRWQTKRTLTRGSGSLTVFFTHAHEN